MTHVIGSNISHGEWAVTQNQSASNLRARYMQTYEIDPIHDRAWLELVERHPRSSVFHTPGWLRALGQTYGYEPIALTTSPPGCKLTNGVALCRVSSWLTGRRIVSVPFSDHCEPLVNDGEELYCMLENLHDQRKGKGWKYIEIRPVDFDLSSLPAVGKSQTYCLHRLDLCAPLENINKKLHVDCIRRKIRRAERENLDYETGRSEPLLEKFYCLLVSSRRTQRLPPQPLSWFRNLIACMGDSLTIHVASRNGEPIASILTLIHKTSLVFKYGCSNRQYNTLGGMQLLLWNAIREAKDKGLQEFDMGRSDWDNSGLIKFKDRWGADRSTLTYWRYGELPRVGGNWSARFAGHIFKHLSKDTLSRTGSLLYRHFG